MAFIVAGFVVLLVGENPFRAAVILVEGAFGKGTGIAFTLFYATTFIFTGLSVAVAAHCGLFNIGTEGQAYIAGLGVANPIGQIWAASMMLAHLGEMDAAEAIMRAIERALVDPRTRTRDLGGSADTAASGKAIAEMLE